jgi:hypothetical protein
VCFAGLQAEGWQSAFEVRLNQPDEVLAIDVAQDFSSSKKLNATERISSKADASLGASLAYRDA